MNFKTTLSLSIATSLCISQAIAQTTNLESITVTAQKSKEDVQNVPISMSVFDDLDLEDKSIESLDDIAKYTPNLMLFNTGQQGLTPPSMRGLSANVLSFSTPVSLYVDGVPTMNSFGYADALEDVERIEVLRGPQGTLYGKNSEAGVINVITKKPNNEARGKLYTTIGSDGKRLYGINVSGPIAEDILYLAIAYQHNEKDGNIKNTLTNEYVNFKENNAGKITLRYTPTENLDISLIASKSKNNNGAHDWIKATSTSSKVSSNLPSSSEPSTTSIALNVDYHLNDDEKITSITTWREHKDNVVLDADLLPTTIQHTFKDNVYSTLSQELRYETTFSDTKLISGLYLDKEKDDLHTKIITLADPTGANSKPQDLTQKSLGLFTNVIHPLSEKWTLNTGIRYDVEKKNMDVDASNIHLDDQWHSISPKLSLQYTINAKNISYATVAKGYRSGGFNPFAPTGKQIYDEENLISYELGYKGMFLNDTLKLNADIYLMKINDMQVEEMRTGGVVYIVNAAKATSKGLEVELEALLNPTVTFFASGGLNDTSYDNFSDTAGNYDANKATFAPKYNFNVGIQYRNASGYYARCDVNGYGKTYFDKANRYSQDAYTLVDTKIGYETKAYDVYLYAHNLFDKEYNARNAYMNGTTTIVREGREIGVKFAYRF
ncbi:MAG: TonB-dependent receptor [Epsilonproteobacteria bacterium]|nr:TonB-dependent receptor [Campylobacterota bacterium]